ncbi:hypothetical protein RCL1_005068 [Eukaryota sp. TZLM3-RCL]
MPESIFNLIPEPIEEKKREPLYRSRHAGTIPVQKRERANFGNAVEPRPNPKEYLKKYEKTGTMTNLEKRETCQRTHTHEKKAPIPSRTDVPKMGLVSNKNFITSNAIEAILQRPPPTNNDPLRFTKKPDYGKVPGYLETVKQEIHEEYDTLRRIQTEQDPSYSNASVLSDEERLDLLEKLKHRWEEAYAEFSRLPMVVETESKITRKNYLERLLNQLDKDIKKLERDVVIIH